ncbi:SpoIIE family protein phosphatase [Blastococcus sp. TF02A_35]|uniref:SpoIIE family protein phosphatase n=1 Tax=Blastococcus sp. TF02A-35 TaxID=2559612 RepID=UPI001073C202|nr:SpoIIE family protein phosphatase [Blastococcus sp. TF02A_35]TFV50420.1 GAF domain-containing protein [Blastococcus sp. TF02A_35]
MTGPDAPGRCVVVEPSTADVALLRGLSGVDLVSPGEIDARLGTSPEPVDLVVVGSLAASPVALAQRAHRLVPGASVAVLSTDPAAVRRQVSYAPGVPLDVLVGTAGDTGLLADLRQLREAAAGRRRHAAVLAAVARRAAAAPGGPAPGPAAVGSLLEHAPIAVLVVAPSGELLGWNRRAELVLELGQAPTGHPVDEVVPGALAYVAQLAADGPPPAPVHLGIGDRLDVELTAVRSQTDQGRPVVLLLVADVTAQRRAERERDRLAEQVQLLARVSETLAGSLDVEESMARLADALVPVLGDWVSIQLREERDQLAGVTVRHRDPALAGVTREIERVILRRAAGSEASRRAAGGDAVLFPSVDEAVLADQVPDEELRALVRRLGTASALAVPVPGRSGLLGSLLLARGPGRAPLEQGDLALAVEIGHRAGIALDNARLYAGQRHLATELQRSLLTDPPHLPGAAIAVRYVAAAREAQVGGDWYDAFRLPDGDLVLVIGDVVGHDTRAAAAMGQLRSLVRGIGFTTAATPAEVLAAVDRAVDGLQLATMATAVLAQLRLPGDGEGPGLLRWSNAGHPAPVLLGADGRARLLGAVDGAADLLLGVDPAARRRVEEAAMAPGDTLLLYTDGLVESRSHALDEGLDLLLATVERHADEGLDALCDAVLDRMVPRGGQDDVALVAVRPRAPGVAGP